MNTYGTFHRGYTEGIDSQSLSNHQRNIQNQDSLNAQSNPYIVGRFVQRNEDIGCEYSTSNAENLTSSQSKTVHGAIKVNYITYFFLFFVFLAPMYSYHMAVSKGQELPFPHTTITDTAIHYPQNIQFRMIMTASGSFLSMIFLVIFGWVKYQQQRTGYTGNIYSKLGLLSQASVWGLMAGMGTIDGAGYPNLHTIGAVFFFIVLFLVVLNQTYVLREMHKWDPTVLSKQSYVTKTILALYVAAVWGYCAYGLGFGFGVEEQGNRFIVILEWNSVYVCLVWVLSFNNDWSNVYLTLTQQKPSVAIE